MKKEFHFSIDDVFESLIEVSDKNMPIKKHYFFKILYTLWKKHKIKTGLHLFYQKEIQGRIRTLKEVRNLEKELRENWIYFNIHGLDPETPPYKQTIKEQKKTFDKISKEISRFSNKKYFTSFTRLHHYSESFELKEYFKKKKIQGLFSTDRKVGSHRMSKKSSLRLIEKGEVKFKGMNFFRTDFRVEWLEKENLKDIKTNFIDTLRKKNKIIIYSHEYELKRKNIRKTLMKLMGMLSKDLKLVCQKP